MTIKAKALPLKELSIDEVYNGDKATYEVPIYQRNYAWEKDEISALIQDVYDACMGKKQTYFVGTLVSFNKGNQVYEVIDGQQRLTTISLILSALGISFRNKLTYRARRKSNDTIQSAPSFEIDEKDYGIVEGYKSAQDAINEIVPRSEDDRKAFKDYFQKKVHLIHYQVPKDIDLNHYFEVMNSRGEQLEKHEIIKARLIEKLNGTDKAKFNRLWGFCCEMNVYIQQKYDQTVIFGSGLCKFNVLNFDALPVVDESTGTLKINELIKSEVAQKKKQEDKIDTFQPIMDFSNFLLIVLKLCRMDEKGFFPINFSLDDKELINEFDKVQVDEQFSKQFGFYLLKAKFLLDNYLVHHSNDEDTIENNPWKLQQWQKRKEEGGNRYLKNTYDKNDVQQKLVQLLSMFEVSFSARQRKNYLFYCLRYLFQSDVRDADKYCDFLLCLADKYFKDVYLSEENLNEINTPNPGSFDSTVLKGSQFDCPIRNQGFDFTAIYGNGTEKSKGISLFVFNYLDYKLWEKYANELRGSSAKEGDKVRTDFFSALGCSDFDLKVFDQFYFSRTRRSLEHYFPQANANGVGGKPNQAQINCFGNYAMIGSKANSSGSNWTPVAKRVHYLDASGKVKLVSVASIKFMIMMQRCKDNENSVSSGLEWSFETIKEHQEKMLGLLFGGKQRDLSGEQN
ncbi:MAG: DUF262 domain-containing protein [Gammaproteobacteria bacterium]